MAESRAEFFFFHSSLALASYCESHCELALFHSEYICSFKLVLICALYDSIMATAIEAVTAVLIGLVLVSSSRVRADIHLYVDSIKGNDSLCTPYPNYIMPYSNISCKTIQYALHGNANYASCTEATPLQDVTVHLADGIHSIAKEICITYSGNVALVADHNGQASIQCATFPYNDTTVNRRYENLYLYAAAGVTFRGLNFEHCGVSSSNVFINSSSDILFDKCVFRFEMLPIKVMIGLW